MDSTTTNWAEVAQSLVEKGESAVLSLANTIQDVAPIAWEIMIKQVYVEVITNVFVSVCLLIIAMIVRKNCVGRVALLENEYDGEGWRVGLVVSSILSCILAISSTLLIALLIRVLINPEYYAIKRLIEMSGLL